MAGGAAAALTGLILVAVSLHLKPILNHPLYRDRSFSSLQGLVTILVISGAVLIPQPLTVLGIEVVVVTVYWLTRYAQFIRLFRGVQPRRRRAATGTGREVVWVLEWIGWFIWVVALAASGVLLWLGDARAFYLLAFTTISAFVLIVWNAWVLLTELAE